MSSPDSLGRAGEGHRKHRGHERLGAGPLGGDEANGVTGRVRGVTREGLEAGEQDGRHRFSLRGVR